MNNCPSLYFLLSLGLSGTACPACIWAPWPTLSQNDRTGVLQDRQAQVDGQSRGQAVL
ncbi:MAG TPA: hypothetical protein VMT46_07580 [Anaerolineaceae bacterium]|nr:hypothetical protein [Anaerolineaceae bacterium]